MGNKIYKKRTIMKQDHTINSPPQEILYIAIHRLSWQIGIIFQIAEQRKKDDFSSICTKDYRNSFI